MYELTAREAARELGVSRAAVLKAFNRGTLRGLRAGPRGGVMFERAEVARYRAQNARDGDATRVLERDAYRLQREGVDLPPHLEEAARRYAARRRQRKVTR